jgi:hypothetical protein
LENRTSFAQKTFDRSVSKKIHCLVVQGPKRLPARFYRSDSGKEPVREWLKILGEDVKDVEFSWPIGMPLVRSLGSALWQVRSSLPRGRIARVIFCVVEEQMVLLHAFIKKTQKTPKQDLDLALRRMKGDLG